MDTQSTNPLRNSRYSFLSALDYCIYLGIDPSMERNAFCELDNILRNPLPGGWTCEYTMAGHSCGPGIPYFVNASIQLTQWEHPDEENHLLTVSRLLVSAPRNDSRVWPAWRRHFLVNSTRFSDSIRRPVAATPSSDDGEFEWAPQLKHFSAYFSVNPRTEFGKLWLVFLASNCPIPQNWEELVSENGMHVFLKLDLTVCAPKHPCDGFFQFVLDKSDDIFLHFLHKILSEEGSTHSNRIEQGMFDFGYDWKADRMLTEEALSEILAEKLHMCSIHSDELISPCSLYEKLRSILRSDVTDSAIQELYGDISEYCLSWRAILETPYILYCLQDISYCRKLSDDARKVVYRALHSAYSGMRDARRLLHDLLVSVIDIRNIAKFDQIREACWRVLELSHCLNYSWDDADSLVLWYMRSAVPGSLLMQPYCDAFLGDGNSTALNEILRKMEELMSPCSNMDTNISRVDPRKRMINILRAMNGNNLITFTGLSCSNLQNKLQCCDIPAFETNTNILHEVVDLYPPGIHIATETALYGLPTAALLKLKFLLNNLTQLMNGLLLDDLQERDTIQGEVATKEASIYLMSNSK